MPSTFTLGEKYEQILEELVSSGDYGNKSEAVRAGIRMLQRDRIQWADIIEGHRAALADPRPRVTLDEAIKRLGLRVSATGEVIGDENLSTVGNSTPKS